MNATVLSGNLYRAAYDAVHPLNDNGKRETRCKGSKLPILNHVMLKDHDGRLAIYSHDLETPIVAYAPARIDESFAICAPAHPLLDWLEIIKKDDSRVDLTVDAAACLLVVQAGNARATFKCLDAGEFPGIAGARESGEKDTTLASVGLAVSRDDARPQLQKVCHRDGLMVGADSFRIHLAPSDKTEIPEGYPDVTPILATLQTPAYTVIVPAVALTRAVKSLKAVSKAAGGWITFRCNGSIEITADSAEAGTSRAAVDVLNSTGGKVEFTLQASYVLDALAHVAPKAKNAKRDGLLPQTVTIQTAHARPDGTPAPIWFVNGDLKAGIMQRYAIPEGTAKPTKSELMSAYNRKRAQLRRDGMSWKVTELNRAFGNLQRRNWQEVTLVDNTSITLLGIILTTRAAHCLAIVPLPQERKENNHVSVSQ